MGNPHARGTAGNKGNRNPFQGRVAWRLLRKPGDLAAAQLKLWKALCCCEEVLLKATEGPEQLKAAHAIAQVAAAYTRLLEVGEIEARLSALEAIMQRKAS